MQFGRFTENWERLERRGSESNRRPRLCRPLHDHSATPPGVSAAAMARLCRSGRANEKGELVTLSL
jgi:hypothetical protein